MGSSSHGYYDTEQPPPEFGGEGHCIHCLFAPCIVTKPPNFLFGQSGPHIRNNNHRYKLYRQFWRALKDLGLWSDGRYLTRKREVTLLTDPREIIPVCIVNVSYIINV